ncbi:C25 family cysteine peptidase [Marinifilum flexuosum]|uniref:C25 family cysteine peptidase n=1 Tax=Marinifilum flexuosum TaxID=1117708 RepID=UPI002492C6B5|nr:C25 family cysteine peptidase [Marinifilum flexuosum]
MKKNLYFFRVWVMAIGMLISVSASAQKREHIKIDPNTRYDKNELVLKSAIGSDYLIDFKLNSYDLLYIASENAYKVEANNMGDILEKGNPALPRFAQSIMIPSSADMQVEVLSSEFIEIKNFNVVPSKGDLTRDIDPKSIPYVYGEAYQHDDYYPTNLASLNDPYILRSVRGQALVVNPIAYNPIQNILRIYTDMELKVSATGKASTKNTLSGAKSAAPDKGFDKVYESHFLNYAPTNTKYAALNDEPGNMLIICYDDYMDEMADFVAWKKQKGIPVEMVAYSTIGSASAIKTYVSNYYNTNGLTYLLLVGDAPQVPTSSTSAGDSDNNYGFIVGNDHYIDIFVGRFSAQTAAQVTTQVERTIHYERDIKSTDTWLASGVGIASDEGYNPSDEEHMNAIQTKLEGYGYTISRCYQDGGSAAQLTNLLNAGKGIINYVGHGSNTGFASMVYTNTNVNNLTNDNKLPFIFDVACVNGNFKNMTCFAETWLRATHNGKPTGAMAICASTINQSWVPPMIAQNEMNDILIESYANNIRRTFTGMALNGMFKMVDVYGSGGEKMIDTWTVFGDPSLQVRTKTPTAMQVNHTATATPGSNSFSVNSNTNDAWVSMTLNGEIIGTAKINNGSANVSISPLPSSGVIKLTVTAYNKIPYVADINITGSGAEEVVANFTANKTSIFTGESINFTDLSSNNPTSWNWSFTGGTPTVSTSQNPTVTYNTEGTYSVSLTAANSGSTNTKTITNMITVSAPVSQTYCEATTNGCSSYEYISNVSFETINNNTTCDGYSDNTSQVANVEQGQSYDITVSIGRPDSRNQVSAWFDWNRDGEFSGADEEYVLNYNYGSSVGTATGSIQVPATASIGATRMRVRVTYNVTPQACGNTTYGEIEDYGIQVGSGSSSRDRALGENTSIKLYPNPATDYFKLEQSGISGELSVKIINLAGTVVNTFISDGSDKFDISNLSSGIYIVQISSGEESWTKKLVVK